jgi:hypothetical protein
LLTTLAALLAALAGLLLLLARLLPAATLLTATLAALLLLARFLLVLVGILVRHILVSSRVIPFPGTSTPAVTRWFHGSRVMR